MPTQNPRLSIAIEKPLLQIITKLAKKEGISISLKTRDLIKEALEMEEDLYWEKEADKRAKTFDSKKALSHEEVWK